jgi:hypothetical protein
LTEFVEPAADRLDLGWGEAPFVGDLLVGAGPVVEQLQNLFAAGAAGGGGDGAERAPVSLVELDGDLVGGTGEARDDLDNRVCFDIPADSLGRSISTTMSAEPTRAVPPRTRVPNAPSSLR